MDLIVAESREARSHVSRSHDRRAGGGRPESCGDSGPESRGDGGPEGRRDDTRSDSGDCDRHPLPRRRRPRSVWPRSSCTGRSALRATTRMGEARSSARPCPRFPISPTPNGNASRTDAELLHSVLEGKGQFMLPMKDKFALAHTDPKDMVAFMRSFQPGKPAVASVPPGQSGVPPAQAPAPTAPSPVVASGPTAPLSPTASPSPTTPAPTAPCHGASCEPIRGGPGSGKHGPGSEPELQLEPDAAHVRCATNPVRIVPDPDALGGW